MARFRRQKGIIIVFHVGLPMLASLVMASRAAPVERVRGRIDREGGSYNSSAEFD